MSIHVMRCSLCESPMLVYADKQRNLMVGCEKCGHYYTLDEVKEGVKDVGFTNPLKSGETTSKALDELLKKKRTR